MDANIVHLCILADTFIQSDLQCIQDIHFFISMCVPWELNPQPFAPNAMLYHWATGTVNIIVIFRSWYEWTIIAISRLQKKTKIKNRSWGVRVKSSHSF